VDSLWIQTVFLTTSLFNFKRSSVQFLQLFLCVVRWRVFFCFIITKKTKRFDDLTVHSELCTVDSHNELSFSLIVFISVLFVGGFLDFGGFLDLLGAVYGGWDSY